MKEEEAFAAFLQDVVNLNQTRLDQLDTRVAAIVACLEADETLGWRVEEHIPQGSWAHRTIIKPLPEDEFDADILLVLTAEPDWATDPGEYLRQVRAALQRSRTYNGKTERKNRCVRVRYAGDCHVDVVPCIEVDGQTQIVNYDEQKFELTNPDGLTAWIRARDGTTRGNLRKVIRVLKYLRDFKSTFTVPSVILATLVGGRVSALDAAARYVDVPTALKALLEDLDAYLDANPTMPYLEDPSCPGTSFNHRWTQAQYETFTRKVSDYLGWVTDAYLEKDHAKSFTAWRRVFGDDFPDAATRSAWHAGGPVAWDVAPDEQFIEHMFPILRRGGIGLDARVVRVGGFEEGWLSRMGSVHKSKSLRFTAKVDLTGPYDLYWKVRNTGQEAARVGQLRGEISQDAGRNTREEHTKYAGVHYVECYAVQSGSVVATGRIEVSIRD